MAIRLVHPDGRKALVDEGGDNEKKFREAGFKDAPEEAPGVAPTPTPEPEPAEEATQPDPVGEGTPEAETPTEDVGRGRKRGR
jgi:hypothetical protein